MWELKELTESCQLLKKGSESALEVRRCTTKFYHFAHMRRRRSPVPMEVYIPVNSSICIRTLKKVYSSCESWKSEQSLVSCLKRALKVLWKCADVPRNSTTLHTCAEGDHLFNGSLYPSEQFYMHKNTQKSVFIVWELKELTESCQLLKKGSESALEVRRCTTKFYHLAHMRRRRSPVQWKFISQWTVLYE